MGYNPTWLDDRAARNGQPPSHALWRDALGAAFQHARTPRVVIAQHMNSTLAVNGGSQSPWVSCNYAQTNPMVEQFRYHVVVKDQEHAVNYGGPTPDYATAGTINTNTDDQIVIALRHGDNTVEECNAAREYRMAEDLSGGIAGSYETITTSLNWCAPSAVVMYEVGGLTPGASDGTAVGNARISAAHVETGGVIVDGDVTNTLAGVDKLWDEQRKVLAQWSSQGRANASAMSWNNQATPTSMLDNASTAYSENTPGLFCPLQYAGRALETTTTVTCAVYANSTAVNGATVTFISGASGADNTKTITVSNVAQWYSVNGLLARTNVACEKVDVLVNTNGNKTVYVWNLVVQDDPQ